MRAASKGDSIENTASTLNQVPCSNDLRYHLDKINNFSSLESQFILALKSRIPPRIKKGRHPIAIDLNLIPYYGNPSSEELPDIYRSKGKSGTCSFYAYATLYVIKKGKRVTLATRGVRWLDTSVAILTYLLAELSFFFVVLSFLLVNIWVNLLWRKVCKPRRGGRLIDRHLFSLKQMLAFLQQAVDRIDQVVEVVYIPSG